MPLDKTATTSTDIHKAPLILQQPMRWPNRFLHLADKELKTKMHS